MQRIERPGIAPNGLEGTAFEVGEARAADEAAAHMRWPEHPAAASWAIADGPCLWLPQCVPATRRPVVEVRSESFAGTFRDLLASVATPSPRSGRIDTTRHLAAWSSRSAVDRLLALRVDGARRRGPDLGGASIDDLRVETATGRVISTRLGIARMDGFPDLDEAARALEVGSAQLPAPVELAAHLHVWVREAVHRRDDTLARIAAGWVEATAPPRSTKAQFVFEAKQARRTRLFSRYYEGIRHDDEGLFSATPEALALRIAERFEGHVLDGTCGIGSITIALARNPRVTRVTACDTHEPRLALARHNAAVYGVAERIRFVHADSLAILASERFDGLVLDPPWGGRDYDRHHLSLASIPFAVSPALALHAGYVAIKLPRSFATEDLPGFAFERFTDERGGTKFVLATRGAATLGR